MPQLDFNLYTSQLFWFVISFSTLYIFISMWFIPRLERVIYNRRNYFANMQTEIDLMNEKIEQLSFIYEHKLDEALAEIKLFKIQTLEEKKDQIYQNHIVQINQISQNFDNEKQKIAFSMEQSKVFLSQNIGDLVQMILTKQKISISEDKINAYLKEKPLI